MTTKKIAGHDDTTPAFKWQGLQLFAEEEGGAGDGAGAADAAAAPEGAAVDGTGGQVSKDPAATGADDAKDGEAAAPKADGDKKPDDAKEDDKAKDGPPEKYDIDVPEGFTVDETLLGEFTDLAREMGLNNDQANKLAGMHTKVMQDAFQALTEARNQEVQSWGEDAKKELGKDLDGTLREVAVGVQEIEKAIPTFREAMDKTGFGNTIEGIKLMAAVGKLLGEDQGGKDTGGKSTSGADELGKLLFPNSQK
ncbi:MAG: hypothetical protein VB133_07530 [Anaeromusa sp.]|uniref:hypothetical protein n=1 Tax=Anaeromusa sp. TaxID=1872520 RepID=UPI002B2132EB|nr:hypothetical protein [Anaeromusa sp.]MEA4834967.1 hypothetical protein [Anaeromusa sp.]